MFEAYTYSALMKEVLAMAPAGLDIREGSIFYDAVSAVTNKIAKLYTDLDAVFNLVFITTASDEYLDAKAAEYAMERLSATAAKYLFVYTGTTPDIGWRFFHNDSGYYFTLQQADDGTLYLEAETAGTDCNYISEGDIAVPVNTVRGLTTAFFGAIYEYGTDTESDEDLRERLWEKINGPAENGNRQHYKTWCESIDGVGRAYIEPLWIGENTVRAILVSPLGLPCADSVVDEVQQYIDPNDLGMTAEVDGVTYVFGDGLGNGVANIGAHFTACAAFSSTINIKCNIELVDGVTQAAATEAITETVTEYLKDLAINAEDGSTVIVRVSAIGALLAGLTSYLVDYTDLTINEGTENIRVGATEVPVLGEVEVNVVS